VRGDDLSASHIAEAAERSLRRLGVDTIDLLQAHSWDAHHPIDETMQAFARLVASGKVRYVGVSNFDVPRLEAARRARSFQALQPRYNLLDREVEAAILPYCQQRGIGVLAHSPLAKGVLTGRYEPGHVFAADDERAQMARFQGDEFSRLLAWTAPLGRWAEERGHTLLDLEFSRSYRADVEVTRPWGAEVAMPGSACAFRRKSEVEHKRAEADGAPINHTDGSVPRINSHLESVTVHGAVRHMLVGFERSYAINCTDQHRLQLGVASPCVVFDQIREQLIRQLE
jgi:hypothetical protein